MNLSKMLGAAAPVTDGIPDDELNKLLAEREAARRQKDYNEADRVCCAPVSRSRCSSLSDCVASNSRYLSPGVEVSACIHNCRVN